MAADRKRKTPILGELRASQVITTFGPGAVVDLPSLSVVMGATSNWRVSSDHVIDEPRLRALVRTGGFRRPPVSSDNGRGVPAYVFPRYLVCPRCNRLGPFDRQDLFKFDGRRFRCTAKHTVKVPKGGPVAFPARFVVACSEGHLDDFPWYEYAHRGKDPGCRPLSLEFLGSSRSGAVSDLSVRCTSCGAPPRSMGDAFGERAQKALGRCAGRRPWLGDDEDEDCTDGRLRTVLRGASNLYFPYVQSAISIPDWDDPVHTAIAQCEEQLTKADSVETIKAGIDNGFLPSLEGFRPEDVLSALEKRREQEERRPAASDLMFQEFQALGETFDARESTKREFESERVEVPESFSSAIDRVSIIRRLREVRTLRGFSRIDSSFDLGVDEETEQFRIQDLTAHETGWLPAIELRGEGVFIAMDESSVRKWETSAPVVERAEALEQTHHRWRRARELPEADFPGSRYVLLHSLAHVLITQMSLDCGYSSTSLRERVYASADERMPMAGILIYTATPDSDGSLGGLADLGQPQRLGPIMREALERTAYCSSDPLCAHNAAGELGHLNGAACHACLFVSETSCERSNRYLDRAHLVTTLALAGTNYFE